MISPMTESPYCVPLEDPIYTGHDDDAIVLVAIVPVDVVIVPPTGVACIATEVPDVIVIIHMVGAFRVKARDAPPFVVFPE
jgi:hypothetical protein